MTQILEEIRDFRQATMASFNAMREDIADLRNEICGRSDEVDRGFTEMRGRFDEVDRGFIEMRGKLDALVAGQQQILELVNILVAQRRGQPDKQ